jgi:hypothetical protein
MVNCPYCLSRVAVTREHIFPQFLGGAKTITACAECNNDLFGLRTEGVIAKQLAPLIVHLSQCGLKPQKNQAWKRAFSRVLDEVEIWYDLKSDGTCARSEMSVKKDENGNVTTLYLHKKDSAKQKRTLESAYPGTRYGFFEETEMVNPPKRLEIQPPLSTELQRLSIKMCVALAAHFNISDKSVCFPVRQFLLDAEPFRPRVFNNLPQNEKLEALRNGFKHSVYVEGNPVTSKCYGIVEYFGFIQIFVQLHQKYVGPQFSVFGALDLVSRIETFKNCEPISIAQPEKRPSTTTWIKMIEQNWQKLDMHVKREFGANLNLTGEPPRIIK